MEIPSELFKYRNFEKYTILSLLNKGLWLPKPSQLNDPFDVQFKLNDADVSFQQFKDSFVHFQSWYFDKYKKRIKYNTFDLLFENNKPTYELKNKVRLFQKYWNSNCEKYGIFSLSETSTNSTMWSHYADNHSGICIGYDPKKLFYQSPNNAIEWLKKVTYEDELNIIRNAYLLYAQIGMGIDKNAFNDFFRNMLSIKSKDWSYEQEWRFYFPNSGGQIFNLNIDAITSITFGLKTPEETKAAISHILRYHQKKTCFYQVKRAQNVIGIIREPLKDKDDKYWFCSYE